MPVEESHLDDAWAAGAEYVLMKAKLRPAVVVSTEKEHAVRNRARLVPLHTISEGGFYETNRQAIRDQDIPGLYWIDGLRINGVVEPRVADCTSMVKVPLSLLAGRQRIGLLDPKTLLALKEFWSESVVL
jgi:hypothetical protein